MAGTPQTTFLTEVRTDFLQDVAGIVNQYHKDAGHDSAPGDCVQCDPLRKALKGSANDLGLHVVFCGKCKDTGRVESGRCGDGCCVDFETCPDCVEGN